MATVTFGFGSGVDFNVGMEYATYTPGPGVVRSDNRYMWYPNGENQISFSGAGFEYDGSHMPTAGTVSQMVLDLNVDGRDSDIRISGLSFDLSVFNTLSTVVEDYQNDLIWHTVLAGDDTIDTNHGGTGQVTAFAGDGRNTFAEVLIFSGNDTITGSSPGVFMSGDFASVWYATSLYAGDDSVKVNFQMISGDADVVDGLMLGGDDTIVGGASTNTVSGDAIQLNTGATVFGGDDKITVVSASSVCGDVELAAGLINGGNDVLNGSKGNDSLFGDISQSTAATYLVGGKDLIHGNGGADHIYGDWASSDGSDLFTGVKAVGGSDRLFGDAGNDTIYGDAGNDSLDGGTGRDKLDGGQGNDRLTGGSGADVFVFSTGYGKDTILDLGKGDIIDVDAWKGINNFSQVKSHATDHGKDVWITVGDDTIVIVGHHKLDLVASEFAF